MIRGAALAGLALLAACAGQPAGGSADGGKTPGELRAVQAEDLPPETSVPVDSLLHVRSGELRSRFGDPHAQRRDGGAIVWNYEADGVCRLNLVLQGVRGSATEVVHAQARMGAGATEQTCFERLRQEARVSPVPVEETVVAAPVVAPVPVPAGPRAAARPGPRAGMARHQAVARAPAAQVRGPAARAPAAAARPVAAARPAAAARSPATARPQPAHAQPAQAQPAARRVAQPPAATPRRGI